MNRFFRIVFVGTLLLLCCCSMPANAQFFKELFGGKDEKKHTRKQPAKQAPVTAKKPAGPVKKTHAEQLGYPVSQLKKRYRIDVLAPIYLDELVKNDKPVFKDRFPDKSLTGINFYEGIKLALDTLKENGYKLDVYIHDIEDATSTTATLVGNHSLDSSDLIIGMVPTAQVDDLAAYAKKLKINFISALSPSDGNVKDNPYFTLLQPTLQTHCEWLRNVIAKRYNKKSNIVVYRRSNVPVDETAFKNITGDKAFTFAQVNANTLMKREQLRNFFDSTINNVVIIPVVELAYAEQLLHQLGDWFPDYKFEVYGMPSWKGMNVLHKPDSLQNLGIYVTAPFYFDGSTASGLMVTNSYKRTFGRRAGDMVYRGYETVYWYAYLLNKYGHTFNNKMGDNGTAIFTRFDIKPQWDKDDNLLYNENQHLYLYRYQGGNMMVDQSL